MRFCNIEIGNGTPMAIGLSVTDALGPDMASRRMTEILDRTEELECFRTICVRDDISDPDIFRQTVEAVRRDWSDGIVLESRNPSSLLMASTVCEDGALLSGCDHQSLIGIGSMTGFPVVLRCDDISTLLDMVQECGTDCVLDPDAKNMKTCLERNTDLHRLSTKVPEADHPIMTRAWSGEYAMAMASVSAMRYGSLMMIDDMDREGCMILDSLSSSFRGHE